MDRADHYRIYGMKMTMDGDKISVDFASATRKKTTYADFEEGADDSAPFVFEQAAQTRPLPQEWPLLSYD